MALHCHMHISRLRNGRRSISSQGSMWNVPLLTCLCIPRGFPWFLEGNCILFRCCENKPQSLDRLCAQTFPSKGYGVEAKSRFLAGSIVYLRWLPMSVLYTVSVQRGSDLLRRAKRSDL